VTSSRDRGPRRLVALFAALAAFAVVGGLASCGQGRSAETVEILVPAGTQQRLEAGEDVVVMPARLELRVGDTLRIRNEDEVAQSVGPYRVGAGQEISFTYGAPGVYEGYCPLSADDRYEIVVTS
jgi:plastocyanin